MIPPQVGCVIVAGVEDGTRTLPQQQGEILSAGINTFLVWDKKYGMNQGKHGRRKPDCHAEANAVAECALLGKPLLGATCYVTKVGSMKPNEA